MGSKIKIGQKPEGIPSVPEMTVEVAKATFPKRNVYIQMRDAQASFMVVVK